MKNRIVFVILHYKNIKDTLECINSIKNNLNKKIYKIVVVDNNSGNKQDDEKIKELVDDLLVLDENVGYAKGNNKGVEIAKKYNSDYIAVINNDTLIEQKDLIEQIDEIYKETSFDALGFKIITNNGDSINPFPAYKTLEEVENAIKKSEKFITIYQSKFKRKLLETYRKIKYTFVKVKHLQNGDKQEIGVSLHGCAIIFSKKYIEKYNDCFYNETFLFHEEEFLEQRRQKDNLIFVYDPRIEIYHKEGSSLNYDYDEDTYKKLIFREQEIIKSLKLLKEYIKENNNK